MRSAPPASNTAIHRQVDAAREARHPRLIARLPSGWAVFGERQFVRGYALLLPDPVVADLNALEAAARGVFLTDMVRLGDALLESTAAVRINYAMLGNEEPALHAHVIPRYREEPPALRTRHPFAYDWQAAPEFDAAAERALTDAVRRALARTAP
jgi:diadenosine tetraphosphate (Ap4A) HIT family hydrolase